MQRSFSIVQDKDLPSESQLDNNERQKFQLQNDFSDSDPEDLSLNKKLISEPLADKRPEALPRKLSSAGPSKPPPLDKANSESDNDSDNEAKQKAYPGEYDPKQFANLQTDAEINQLFEYILRYTPSKTAIEYKFKPFIPEFLPAVGDIDAFLKVIPPETAISGDIFDENILQLGLLVLDEPASNQSDPALLHLQLRAASDNLIGENEQKHIIVKKIDNVDKNSKVIDKWIKDVSHLHKSKSSPVVRYFQPMPDIDDLMQQWPEDLEKKFKEEGFPKPGDNQSLSDYTEVVCDYFQIPSKNKIHSLHLLFCLYTAIKQTQLYQIQSVASNDDKSKGRGKENDEFSTTDQLVLE